MHSRHVDNDDGVCIQAWWISLQAPATALLVKLAVLMTDIIPYAASPNDVMASMGWFPRTAKDPVAGALGCKLAILKAYYESGPSMRYFHSLSHPT